MRRASRQAELNYPLTLGDRVYVDLQGLAELETAGLAVRMANGADVTLTSLTDQVAQFGLAQGSIRVATRDLTAPDGSTGVVEIDTPNGTIVVQAAGDIRVDSYPQNSTTVVTVNSGQVEVTGAGLTQVLDAKESVQSLWDEPGFGAVCQGCCRRMRWISSTRPGRRCTSARWRRQTSMSART